MLRRYDELEPVFSRHVIAIYQSDLSDNISTLAQCAGDLKGRRSHGLLRTANQLDDTLVRLEGLLRASGHRA